MNWPSSCGWPNGLPISRRKREKFHENPNDLGREAVGCMRVFGGSRCFNSHLGSCWLLSTAAIHFVVGNCIRVFIAQLLLPLGCHKLLFNPRLHSTVFCWLPEAFATGSGARRR